MVFFGLAVLLLSAGAVQISGVLDQAKVPTGSDFFKFHFTSQYLQESGNLYWPAPTDPVRHAHCLQREDTALNQTAAEVQPGLTVPEQLCLHPNLNPPHFIGLTRPLGRLPFQTAYFLWTTLSLLALAASAVIVAKQLWPPGSGKFLLAALGILAGILAFFPSYAGVQLGQVQFFLLLLLVLAWSSFRNDSELAGGFWLGVAASLKPFFGLFLIALWAQKRWTALAAALVSGLLILLTSIAAFGLTEHIRFAVLLSEVNWHASNWNGSLLGFMQRLFGGGGAEVQILQSPGLTQVLFPITFILAIAGLFAVLRQAHHQGLEFGPEKTDSMFALVVPLMLFLSPLGWNYYFPLLLLPVIYLWNKFERSSQQRLLRIILLGFIALSSIPNTIAPLNAPAGPLELMLENSRFFYTVLGITILSFYSRSVRS